MNIAILGLGAMGSRIAANCIKAGHNLIVYNRNPDKTLPLLELGAIAAHTPREAATKADVVISMVTDDMAARHIWLEPQNGAVHGLKASSIAVESSTVTPAWIAELEPHIKAQNAQLLDAPVVGSRPQAEAGQLIFLVGGEAAVLEQAKPALSSTSGVIHHVGALGQGSSLKLLVNALFAIQVAAISELHTLAMQLGIAPSRFAAILGELPVTSPAAKGTIALIQSGQFTPMFPIALVEKDLRYLLETSQPAMPTSQAVHLLFAQALQVGLGQENIHALVKLFKA